MFPPFWLVNTTRIMHHNQLLLTKFGKDFVILNRWRQNDIKSAARLKVIEPLTEKTWERGSVVLVVSTKWLNSQRNILLVSQRNVVYKHDKNSMKTDDICYLENICRPEQIFFFFKLPDKDALSIWTYIACFSLFLNLELFWRNNKTIIEFGFRRIWRILQILEGGIHRDRRPRWKSLPG